MVHMPGKENMDLLYFSRILCFVDYFKSASAGCLNLLLPHMQNKSTEQGKITCRLRMGFFPASRQLHISELQTQICTLFPESKESTERNRHFWDVIYLTSKIDQMCHVCSYPLAP